MHRLSSLFPYCLPPASWPQLPGWWRKSLIPVPQARHSIGCSSLSPFIQMCCNGAILPSSASTQAMSWPSISSRNDFDGLQCQTLNYFQCLLFIHLSKVLYLTTWWSPQSTPHPKIPLVAHRCGFHYRASSICQTHHHPDVVDWFSKTVHFAPLPKLSSAA